MLRTGFPVRGLSFERTGHLGSLDGASVHLQNRPDNARPTPIGIAQRKPVYLNSHTETGGQLVHVRFATHQDLNRMPDIGNPPGQALEVDLATTPGA